MTLLPRLIAALIALFALTASRAATADEFTAPQRGEIERIIKEYLFSRASSPPSITWSSRIS